MIVGVLGGGQLGRMLALAGLPLGVKFRFLDADPACCASFLGDVVVGAFENEAALINLASGADVVTFEFENVPARVIEILEARAVVRPPRAALAVSQDRVLEKQLFAAIGIPTPRFVLADSLETLEHAVADVGLPCVVKTRRLGYDGKGQAVLRDAAEIDGVWAELRDMASAGGGLVVEQWISFEREISMIAVRAFDGDIRFYPPTQNRHERGILVRSDAPVLITGEAREAYESAARRILEELQYVGVLAVEFFELADGSILANEMAPRVHNSGHWTIDGAVTSQFENHIRAIVGLPLGSTKARCASVMLNIIGAEPDASSLLAHGGVHLHMYGKAPRPGRKIGHITITDADEATVGRVAGTLRNVLG